MCPSNLATVRLSYCYSVCRRLLMSYHNCTFCMFALSKTVTPPVTQYCRSISLFIGAWWRIVKKEQRLKIPGLFWTVLHAMYSIHELACYYPSYWHRAKERTPTSSTCEYSGGTGAMGYRGGSVSVASLQHVHGAQNLYSSPAACWLFIYHDINYWKLAVFCLQLTMTVECRSLFLSIHNAMVPLFSSPDRPVQPLLQLDRTTTCCEAQLCVSQLPAHRRARSHAILPPCNRHFHRASSRTYACFCYITIVMP